MATHPEFDAGEINQSLATAHQDAQQARSAQNATHQTALNGLDDGTLKLAGAQCISVTVKDGKVCLSLPLGIGDVCLPIPPFVPNGTAAQACISICTRIGIPCGVEVTVSALGRVIVEKHWGCSC